MRQLIRRSLPLVLLSCALLCIPIAAQQNRSFNNSSTSSIRPRDRVVRPIDSSRTVPLRGGIHPAAATGRENGRVSSGQRMDRMMLLLEPDSGQQAALEALIAEQQNPESPDYQRWLTPEEFGERFGASQNDIRQIVDWLQGEGFDVEPVPASGRLIVFSGTAAQVERTFSIQMRRYILHGEEHLANSSEPRIPEALAAVVNGFVSLHDFKSAPQHYALVSQPEFTTGSSHYLTPADFATIYDVNALYNASVNGAGQSIAVVGRSNIKPGDVTSFRSRFGLPANDPRILLTGADPGVVGNGEQEEATLDVEWAGAVAPKAAVTLVVSASTSTSDGVVLSAQYAVNNNVAPVITVSFGACEAAYGRTGNAFWNALWQQAAAQGQTVLVASGDSGAAGCDSASAAKATSAAGINALCSSPYSTCVGGTQFQDTSNPGLYWASANGTGYGSALSYIPEAAWNESASGGLWATGGGASLVYSKPVWQSAPGVPGDGKRDVPDVSLTAAGHDAYLIVINGNVGAVAGTSAAAPAFAGVMALTAQKANARIGNANPTFYALATRQAAGGAAVFHDVTAGNNSVPGVTGFNAGTGYDLASGLGSADAFQMVNHWSDGAAPVTPGFTLAVSPSSVTAPKGGSAAVTVSAAPAGGFSTAVALSVSGLPTGVTGSFSASSIAGASGSSTLTLSAGSTATQGAYTVTVTGTAGATVRTATVTLTVGAACSYTLDPTAASLAATAASYAVKVTAAAGCAWTTTTSTSWITLGSPVSGSGNGTVPYSVTANTASSPRAGSLSVGGVSFAVTQSATSAPYSINPAAASAAVSGGSGTITVSGGPAGGSWTATANAAWLTVTKAATGSTVNYSVAANTSSAQRTGTATIAGLTFTVVQAAAPCTYTMSPSSVKAASAGGTYSVQVTVPSGCAWTATTATAWLKVASGASGNGNGTVSLTAAANTTTGTRGGSATIGGVSVPVSQDAPTAFAVSPASASVAAGASTGTVVVTAPSSTTSWTAVSNAAWLTVTSGANGAGNRNVGYSVAANPTSSARSASISMGTAVFTLNQAGASCTVTVNPAAVSAGASGGSLSLQVTAPAGCTWTAVSNSSFLTIPAGASGSGAAKLTAVVAANTGAARTGTLKVGTVTVTVSQEAAPTYTLSATTLSAPAAASTASVTVTTSSATATWRAVSNVSWITVASGATGTGRGAVAFVVAANTAQAGRSGTVTVAGQTVTVNQAGVANQTGTTCPVTLGKASVTPQSSGIVLSIPVSAAATCSWTATSNADWLTVVAGRATGAGVATLKALPNTTRASRTAIITIGNVRLSVSQGGA